MIHPGAGVVGLHGGHHDVGEGDEEHRREEEVRRGPDGVEAHPLAAGHRLHLLLVGLDEGPDGHDDEEEAEALHTDVGHPREHAVGELVEDDGHGETENPVPEGDHGIHAGEAEVELRARGAARRDAGDEGRLPDKERGDADHGGEDEEDGQVAIDPPEPPPLGDAVEDLPAAHRLQEEDRSGEREDSLPLPPRRP